jgi:hypothetical protein
MKTFEIITRIQVSVYHKIEAENLEEAIKKAENLGEEGSGTVGYFGSTSFWKNPFPDYTIIKKVEGVRELLIEDAK